MKTFCDIVCTLFFFSGLGSSIYCRVFWTQLRKRHAETWQALGDPSTIWSPGFLRFLMSRRYESLSDRKTVAAGRLLRRWFIFTLILGALSVIALAVFAWKTGLPGSTRL